MRGPRTQTERDAATVESMYVAVSAVILAGAVFALVASPALVLGWVTGEARGPLVGAALIAGGVTFLARLTVGLWRW